MKKILLFAIMATLYASSYGQFLVRTPSVSPDGSMIAYSLQGDIWTMEVSSGDIQRLTIHEAYESNPIWNDAGDQIAFTSNRAGNNDIYTIPAKGGQPNRITYHATADRAWDWTGDKIYFTTNRAFKQIEWNSEIYQVSASGGTPERILSDFGDMPFASKNSNLIAVSRGSCRTSREDYNGPADLDVWVYNQSADKYYAITDNSVNDYQSDWTNDGSLYFLSARSGRYNIYKQAIGKNGEKSGDPTQLTKFTDDGIRFFDVSDDGSQIVFTRKDGLFLMDVATANIKAVNVSATDYRFDPIESKTFSNNISEYELSPNGKKIASVIRGEVFVTLTDKEKSRAINLSKHAYRDRGITWLNDSTLLFVSDREGQSDIYLVKSVDEKVTDLFKSLKHDLVRVTKTSENESNPTVSPDGKKIFFQRGRGKLVVADIDEKGKLSNEQLLQDGWSTPRSISWSPDSRWLAYSMSDLTFNSEVYIHAADNSAPAVNVSMHPKGDFGPVWSMDGSKLAFVSNRSGGEADVWFTWLKKADWEKTQADRDEGYYFDDEEEKDDKKDKDKALQIDFDRIHDRQQRVTSLPGNEGGVVISADGETFYFTGRSATTNFGSDFYSIKWDGSKIKRLASNLRGFGRLSTSADGKTLYAISRGVVNKVGFKDGKRTPIPHKANMKIDHPAENKQVFEEAWSALNEGFYDPEFHGQNWNQLRDKYKPWCLSATTKQDFQYMFNLMLGQLNASHMGLRGGGTPEDVQRESVGLLGLEVKPAKKGVEITKVVAGTPADKEKSKLRTGEKILSINGMELTTEENFYAHLVGQSGQQVLLEVADKSGKKREVVIRPTRSIRGQLYEEWIEEKRKLTDKYSNGKLGYIHIRGMNLPSFERFERELMASGYGKEGIVIDVRFNGGGWTTDYLMTVLSVKQHAYTIPRGAAASLNENKQFSDFYPYSERLPLTSWTKPSVALCNQSSYSNAEIFSHAYKNLGIGTLVGMPTFGAVISTGGQGLIDGSFVRMPFRAWYVKQTGENMENGPAVPDIQLENAPGERAQNEDSQLKKAVDVLLQDLR
ncbi:MAG: S41 family peptidase [Bacteroidota bacterium]